MVKPVFNGYPWDKKNGDYTEARVHKERRVLNCTCGSYKLAGCLTINSGSTALYFVWD